MDGSEIIREHLGISRGYLLADLLLVLMMALLLNFNFLNYKDLRNKLDVAENELSALREKIRPKLAVKWEDAPEYRSIHDMKHSGSYVDREVTNLVQLINTGIEDIENVNVYLEKVWAPEDGVLKEVYGDFSGKRLCFRHENDKPDLRIARQPVFVETIGYRNLEHLNMRFMTFDGKHEPRQDEINPKPYVFQIHIEAKGQDSQRQIFILEKKEWVCDGIKYPFKLVRSEVNVPR